MRPIVLSIAGSDCSGGAGIQADIKAIEAAGGFATTAVTLVTVQNGGGVARSESIAAELVVEQCEAVFDDFDVAAVKSGALGGPRTIEALRGLLERRRPEIFVLDPVLAAEAGGELLPEAAYEPLRAGLFPLASLITPNVPEAEILSGLPIRDLDQAERAARRLLELGACAVLLKGGHLPSGPATDLLVTATGSRLYEGRRRPTASRRGTGCTLASTIATLMARGVSLDQAVGRAKQTVARSMHGGVGRLHVIASGGQTGRYDECEIADFAIAGGADVVQLREKRSVDDAGRMACAGRMRERLSSGTVSFVVNDRVDLAAACLADGVHLGARDLPVEAARRILGPAALIGGTANSFEEAMRLAAEPVDYVGVGPVYGTGSKAAPAPRIGPEELGRIASALSKPVIAIGGIRSDRVPEVVDAGAHGVALLSALVHATDPAAEVARAREALDG